MRLSFDDFFKEKHFLNRPMAGTKIFYIGNQRFSLFTGILEARALKERLKNENYKIISVDRINGIFILYENELNNAFGYLLCKGNYNKNFTIIKEI